LPRNANWYGKVGKPADPTVAPIGSEAAAVSVAGAGLAEAGAVDELPDEEELPAVVEELPALLGADGS